MFDQNYFLTRLQNGEDLDKIGKEIADMMNAANAAFEEEKARKAEAAALAEKEEAKKCLIEELVEIVQELAILEGMDADDVAVTEKDVEQIIAASTEMFSALRDIKKMVSALDSKPVKVKSKITRSDDDILGDFIKMISQ